MEEKPSLKEELLGHHWGDVVGLFLVSLGVFVLALVDRQAGNLLVGAGLLALKLQRPNGKP